MKEHHSKPLSSRATQLQEKTKKKRKPHGAAWISAAMGKLELLDLNMDSTRLPWEILIVEKQVLIHRIFLGRAW
jgi:hypothetical protein